MHLNYSKPQEAYIDVKLNSTLEYDQILKGNRNSLHRVQYLKGNVGCEYLEFP